MATSPFVVSSDWLLDRSRRLDDVSIVDASWYLPDNGTRRRPRSSTTGTHSGCRLLRSSTAVVGPEPRACRIRWRRPTCIRAARSDGWASRTTDTIVVYDSAGTVLRAARVWWNFRVMGVAKVVVLDGGLDGWIADRLPDRVRLRTDLPEIVRASLRRFTKVVGFDEMSANWSPSGEGHHRRRSAFAGRFDGTIPGAARGYAIRATCRARSTCRFDSLAAVRAPALRSSELRDVLARTRASRERWIGRHQSCGSGVTRRGDFPGAGIDRPSPTTGSTTARGANGAAACGHAEVVKS